MTLRDRLVAGIAAGEDRRAGKGRPAPTRRRPEAALDPRVIAGSLGLIVGGLVWAASMTAVGIVRPSLDSDLLGGPVVGATLIGCGALLVAARPATTTFAARWVRIGMAVTGIGGLLLVLGIVSSVFGSPSMAAAAVIGLLIVLVGSLLTGAALTLVPGRIRLAGVAIWLGLVAGFLSLGPDPKGAELAVKAGVWIATQLCLGLGWAAAGFTELARAIRLRGAPAT